MQSDCCQQLRFCWQWHKQPTILPGRDTFERRVQEGSSRFRQVRVAESDRLQAQRDEE